jgi:hypothetical protein
LTSTPLIDSTPRAYSLKILKSNSSFFTNGTQTIDRLAITHEYNTITTILKKEIISIVVIFRERTARTQLCGKKGTEAASQVHDSSSTIARHTVLKKDFYNVVL